MEPYRIDRARHFVEAAAEASRWIWCVNLVAAVIAVANREFGLAAVAGSTAAMAMVAAGSGRRASRLLARQERSERLELARKRNAAVDDPRPAGLS